MEIWRCRRLYLLNEDESPWLYDRTIVVNVWALTLCIYVFSPFCFLCWLVFIQYLFCLLYFFFPLLF